MPRLRVVEIVAFCLLLGAGWLLRARVGSGWTFTGSDSYNYMGAAEELAEKGRYAFRLPTWYPDRTLPPLGYCRPPLYPLLLSVLDHPPVHSYEQFFARIKPLQRALDLLTCALTFFLAWRISSRLHISAWAAFLLALANPFLIFFTASVLTETLAILLTTATFCFLLLALDERVRRPRLWLAFAGATAALGMLTRLDGVLLLPCLGLPLVLRRDPPRLQVQGLLLAALAVLLVYGPWPLRNLVRFGAPHVLAVPCNVRGEAIERAGYLKWFATWMVAEEQGPQTLFCLVRPGCVATVQSYPPEAFDSSEEKRDVARLFALREREGFSLRVNDGFVALAQRRARNHPLRTFVVLPLRRALHMWINRNDLPLRSSREMPWPQVTIAPARHLLEINILFDLLLLAGLFVLLARPERDLQRRAGALALLAVVLRTGVLALVGFVDARYLLELMPLSLAVGSVAVGRLASRLRLIQ